MSFISFKYNSTYKLLAYNLHPHIYIYIYKQDLALKIPPNKTEPIFSVSLTILEKLVSRGSRFFSEIPIPYFVNCFKNSNNGRFKF